MRYLIHTTQLNEAPARCEYLYDIFKLYFVSGKPEGEYTPFSPVGDCGEDILFIVGHSHYVDKYLMQHINSITEKAIVITSCCGFMFAKYAMQKTIYVPDFLQKHCVLYNGKPFGFNFNISDAELRFYNTCGDIEIRLQKSYKCIRRRTCINETF